MIIGDSFTTSWVKSIKDKIKITMLANVSELKFWFVSLSFSFRNTQRWRKWTCELLLSLQTHFQKLNHHPLQWRGTLLLRTERAALCSQRCIKLFNCEISGDRRGALCHSFHKSAVREGQISQWVQPLCFQHVPSRCVCSSSKQGTG